MKTSNFKLQISGKLQATKSAQVDQVMWRLEFEVWSFPGVWSLKFGVFGK
jgi:hypothetical protein